MVYSEVFQKLTFETAAIIFLKANGEVRLMLGTRNLHTVELMYGYQGFALGGHDRRCNIQNGNIAVYDILLGDARSFNIERLISIEYYGEINTKEQLDIVIQKFNNFKERYNNSKTIEQE